MKRLIFLLIFSLAFIGCDSGSSSTSSSDSSSSGSCYYNGKQLHVGPQGGCYYINSNGNKSYVDRSNCNDC